jgi:hypothetical protein
LPKRSRDGTPIFITLGRIEGSQMVDKIETPQEFYANVVEIDINEFRNKSDDLRLAYHACVSLLSLRDWIFEKYKGAPWTCMGKAQQPFTSKNSLQASLERELDEFRIITDVANASKHLSLDKDRRRTKAEGVANVHIQSTKTHVGGALLGYSELNGAMLNEPAKVVTSDSVIINDGGKLYDVLMSVESANRIWGQILAENNW